jgi:hypothetical protein
MSEYLHYAKLASGWKRVLFCESNFLVRENKLPRAAQLHLIGAETFG